MNRYRPIPKAIQRIERTLTHLNVTPADPAYTPARAIKAYSRYYMTPIRTKQKTTLWFKASLQDNPHLRRALREEIRVQRFFAEYEHRTLPLFDSPSYIAHHDDRRGFLWLVRRYWDGMFAGDMTHWFGFSPAFFRAVGPKTMSRIVQDIRQMTRYMVRRVSPEKRDLGWYMLDFHYYRREFFQPMLSRRPAPGWNGKRLAALEEFFLTKRKFLDQRATAFTHGDLYPTNIMIRPTVRRPVVLFDWELAHLNLPTFDAVMVYLHAWRRPDWQRQFRAATLKHIRPSLIGPLAWRIAMASLATRLAGFCYIRLHHLQPERYPRLPAADRPILRRLYQRCMKELDEAIDGIE